MAPRATLIFPPWTPLTPRYRPLKFAINERLRRTSKLPALPTKVLIARPISSLRIPKLTLIPAAAEFLYPRPRPVTRPGARIATRLALSLHPSPAQTLTERKSSTWLPLIRF